MSAFEEIGAGLGSLSLGDFSRQVNLIQEDDDLMDIDSIESFQICSDTKSSYNSPKDPDDMDMTEVSFNNEEHDDKSSILDILRPTALGAKYALKPRKLLMPPPTPGSPAKQFEAPSPDHSTEPEHDYEFDTSFSTSVSKNPKSSAVQRRDFTDFNAFGRSHKFPQKMNSPFISISEPEVPYYSNMMSISHQRNPDPVQIHHHHYYPPQSDVSSLKNNGILANYNGNASNKIVQSLQQEQISPSWTSLTKRDDHQGLQNTQQKYFPNTGVTSEMLPSPWDPQAVPAERTPYVLSSYLQLLVNVVLSGYALHLVIGMVQAIKQDVAYKLNQEANNLWVEIASCERSYHENHCSPETIVPALEKMCAYWEKCMNQDPSQIGNRSSVSAHTIGMILNSLIEPLSFKVLVFGAATIMVIFACNFAFGYVRAKTYYGWTSANART